MKTNLSFLLLPLFFGLGMASAQNVTIPDANFKNYLLSVPAINTNSDGEIQYSEAAAFTGTINAGYLGISDLSGIEAFTALGGLNCNNNNLSSLNISSNTALSLLNCSVNQLTGLNLSTNTQLSILVCGYNNLTGINSLSATALTAIYCEENNLPNLNVSYNAGLTTMNCANNQLTTLDVLNNPALRYLNCQDNQIVSLDLVANPALQEVRCFNNQLTYLSIQNGNNSNLTAFAAHNNPGLTCIQVDNASYMNSNWPGGKDPTTIYSTNCAMALNVANASNSAEGISVYPNPVNTVLTINSGYANDVTASLYDVNGKNVVNKKITGATDINTDILPNGIYNLVLRNETEVSSRKIVVSK